MFKSCDDSLEQDATTQPVDGDPRFVGLQPEAVFKGHS
jgi:hypothetical protein